MHVSDADTPPTRSTDAPPTHKAGTAACIPALPRRMRLERASGCTGEPYESPGTSRATAQTATMRAASTSGRKASRQRAPARAGSARSWLWQSWILSEAVWRRAARQRPSRSAPRQLRERARVHRTRGDVRSGRASDEERTERRVDRWSAPLSRGLQGDTRMPRRGDGLGSIGRVCSGGVRG